MKKAILLLIGICIASLSATGCGAAPKKQPVDNPGQTTIMTCNVRVTGLPEDETDERRWENRRDVCVEVIRKYDPDIICLQEVMYDSYAYLKEKFSDYFGFGFAGPEMDPYTEGYHFIAKNVIFFNRDRYEMTSAGCYWLSETPLIAGSGSWNTMRARHCNWVRLIDRQTGKEFRVLDLHLDHKSQEAKLEQIKMVVEEAAQYADDFPQILCGDFNSKYQSEVIGVLREGGWSEMYEVLNGVQEAGYTGHAFQGTDYPKGKSRIDFIFFRGNGFEVIDTEIIRDQINGIYPSDHFFVKAGYTLK